MTKYFVVGDIHGCFDEFQELLDRAALSSDDHIITVGDLVNKGPASEKVVDFFQNPTRPNIYSIMGNHEFKHLRAYRGDVEPTLPMLLTRWQLDTNYDAAISYMSKLPLYIDLPDALIVHAYMEPNLSIEEQADNILLGTMGANGTMKENYGNAWYKHYDGEKPLIVGHKDWSGYTDPFNYKDRVYGLDTGCVYGGQLTGLMLPDFEFITVPARDEYWQRAFKRFMQDG